jgi:hypothetical protein
VTPHFVAETHQNEYVAIGATEVEAIVIVACSTCADAVELRLWMPRHTRVERFTQFRPTIEDLTTWGMRVDDHRVDHAVGPWAANESRHYYLRLAIPRRAGGEEMLAAKIMVLIDGREQARSLVKAIWTVNAALSGHVERAVDNYRTQVEPSSALADPRETNGAGDDATVTVRLQQDEASAERSDDEALGEASHTTPVQGDVAAEDLMPPDELTSGTVQLREEG